MTYTTQVTYDNLSLHAVTAPIACWQITMRELATDPNPVNYLVAGPLSTNPVFPKVSLEAMIFGGDKLRYFQPGDIVGYVKPVSGTVTFSMICEF